MDRAFIKEFAKEYIQSAVNYFRKTHRKNNELGHLINLANINIHENNFVAAGVILDRVKLLNQLVKSDEFEGRLHSSYSDYYSRQQKFSEALAHANQSYVLGRKLKIEWLEAVSLYIAGKCYRGLGKNEEQIRVLKDCQKIVESNINLIQLKKGVYDDIQYYYSEKNDFKKAYEFSIKAQKTIENIYFSKIESDVRSFSEYNLLEKQRMVVAKIALEKKLTDIELDKLRIRQQMYIGILILTMLFLSLLVYAFLNKRRIGKLEAIELNKNLHIETLNALINGQELERVRIAQELHDGLGTMLSRTKILMGKGTSEESIIQMIDEACSEVRTISGNLQPNTLTKFGLIRALEDFVFKQNSNNPTIIFQYFGEFIALDMNKNLMIYRIIQELLTNSLKHARASEILIQLVFSEDNLTLTVEDDGIGFTENIANSDSSGWNNIRSRVKYLRGIMNFHSEINAGSSITISIPVK
jgi:signal transduction histidine kinase